MGRRSYSRHRPKAVDISLGRRSPLAASSAIGTTNGRQGRIDIRRLHLHIRGLPNGQFTPKDHHNNELLHTHCFILHQVWPDTERVSSKTFVYIFSFFLYSAQFFHIQAELYIFLGRRGSSSSTSSFRSCTRTAHPCTGTTSTERRNIHIIF